MLSFGYSKILLPLVLVILLGSSNVKSQSIVSLLSSILESLESIENILEQYHPQTITHVSPNWLDRSSLNQIIKITEAKNGFNGKDLNYGIKLENGKYMVDKSNKKKIQSKF
ncbi:PREDICTED: uncharacterized protein LOC105365322 [Ceratosolen solmsi marchali]|uniref:Uncharacterized protein LOC105365322 n=1 Tax=Ceratosolen solmsi marchali TaxID=326594 RepID=A0AAJ6YPE7_9HYME|nr:PREDICTED: uncharacterized protein LOC105365322 [Ceratosolen solmsi marchali]